MHHHSSKAPVRLHHLDALRAAAMLLGLALHAMLAYAGISWVPQDPVSSYSLGVAFAAIHGFRMPLFFLLSGYFTGLLWQRRGMRPLLRHRAARVAMPLGLALFTVLPLNWAAMWWATSGDAPRWLLVQAQATGPVVGMMVFPFFGHLWFLWFLCWLTLAFAMLAPVVKRLAVGLRLPSGRPSKVRDLLLATPLALLWLVPLTALMAIPMHGFGMQPNFGPETSAGILPMPHVLGYFAVFFGFGALCAAVPKAMQGLGRRWWLTLPAACLIFPLALGLSVQAAELASWVPDPPVRRMAALLGQSAYAWLACLGAIGLCGALITRERPVIRWLADASYWMYLAHLPLMIALQTLLLAACCAAGADCQVCRRAGCHYCDLAACLPLGRTRQLGGAHAQRTKVEVGEALRKPQRLHAHAAQQRWVRAGQCRAGGILAPDFCHWRYQSVLPSHVASLRLGVCRH